MYSPPQVFIQPAPTVSMLVLSYPRVHVVTSRTISSFAGRQLQSPAPRATTVDGGNPSSVADFW